MTRCHTVVMAAFLSLTLGCRANTSTESGTGATASGPAASAGAATSATPGGAASSEAAPGSAVASPAATVPSEAEFRDVTIPAGTALTVKLDTAVGSNISRAEDPVRASLSEAVVVDGTMVVLAGATLQGSVLDATRPGKVEGLGHVAFRFDKLKAGADEYPIHTTIVKRTARSTKKEDAVKIGAPAVGGAIIGAIVGGKKGAAIGTAVGAGAGTAAVVTTRGEDVLLNKGASLTVRLEEPLRVRVPRTP